MTAARGVARRRVAAFSGKFRLKRGGHLRPPAAVPRAALLTSSTYDRVAESYDDLWTPNVAGVNARLTAGLSLQSGNRVADLAAGTGIYTLEMARRVAPAEVVAVDYSEGMLAAARDRAEAAGYHVRLVHSRAEDFIEHSQSGAFDVVSMRFVLAYIAWREVLPHVARILSPGGRVGVLTSTTTSVPQFYELFKKFRSSLEPIWKLYKHSGKDLRETWVMFRVLREAFGDGEFISVPRSADDVAQVLAEGGLQRTDSWTETIRLWFDSGEAAVHWARNSGYATHHSLDLIGPEAVRFVERLFAEGMEGYREKRGIPLDLVIAGVVAEKPQG